jgi:hypothetical protein
MVEVCIVVVAVVEVELNMVGVIQYRIILVEDDVGK